DPKVDNGKAEELKNIYVGLIMKSRQLYLDYHESHPGFFASVLFMDDYARAFDSLLDFIYELYINQSYRKPIFLSEMNNFTQIAIPATLKSIINNMTEHLSVSKHQQKTIFKTHRSILQK
ncbi:PREDICTED: uncharacterized protein LOC106748713, partial [Dinoponera quadriceps]|uniref:Uncharacterized protein LOC106748713 n=1 Tax=Dinoponera quadriceps TaxID=609295 RepID=A0A6P3XY47_DINQU